MFLRQIVVIAEQDGFAREIVRAIGCEQRQVKTLICQPSPPRRHPREIKWQKIVRNLRYLAFVFPLHSYGYEANKLVELICRTRDNKAPTIVLTYLPIPTAREYFYRDYQPTQILPMGETKDLRRLLKLLD